MEKNRTMTTDPRECPRCHRMIAPELRDGVPVWKQHGTVVLGGPTRWCKASLTPIREKRTRLGHRIQKEMLMPKALKPVGCDCPDPRLARGECKSRIADPFAGFRG